MSEAQMEPCVDTKDYLLEKVTLDNTPDIGDKTGEIFLDHLELAITDCRKLIAQGFRLTDFWSDPDVGLEFKLMKKKAPGDSCAIVMSRSD
ncbi:MAG: hypothetical protein PHT62_03315 [Desulfotomaculaceae bacterium]|nr:hypothetical protein [Desulfotomaculaceae bacterium]